MTGVPGGRHVTSASGVQADDISVTSVSGRWSTQDRASETSRRISKLAIAASPVSFINSNVTYA